MAYLAPSIVLRLVPSGDVPYRDLVWLLTLVPAYLLSLHYGMRGAVAGLAMGTLLFLVVQLLVAWGLDPEDWRVTVPIYTAYGVIAISVGWLSQQLHVYYARAIAGERALAIKEVAVAMRHEINNALATVMAEAQLLSHDDAMDAQAQASLRSILEMSQRIHDSVQKLTTATEAPVTPYLQGMSMIDLAKLS